MLYLEYIGLLSFFRSLYSCDIRGAEREEEAFEGFELKDHSAATHVPHSRAEREAGQSRYLTICSRKARDGHSRKKNRSSR